MDYNDIKQIIDDNIKPNTSQDITAIIANLVMTAMIDYTRDSIIDIVNQGFGAGAFTWLDVEHEAVIPYPQMSAGRARVVRIFKDNVEYAEGEATIGGVNGVTIKRHALVICLEATNEMANDGMQETVGDRFAVINIDGTGGGGDTTYTVMTLPVLNTGTSTTAHTISAKVLTDWLNGKISTVGFSGSYNDLDNKPNIPEQVNLTEGTNIEITGTYPNITISANVEPTEWGAKEW